MTARRIHVALDLTDLEARVLKQLLTMASGDVEADPRAFDVSVGRGGVAAAERVEIKVFNAIELGRGKK